MKTKKQNIVIIVVAVLALVGIITGLVINYQHRRSATPEQHSTDITTTQFIKQVAPAARQEQKRYHVPASITIAQAGLESNWGRSRLAAKYNNLFGIKANSKQNRVRMYTTENVNGKDIQVKQYFQTYDSWADSIRAHTLLIVNGTADNHDRFKAVTTAQNYRQAALALQQGGYATDPNYASKLIYAIRKYNLSQYDH
ncbi:glycoside hydrolase family 73 protein [Limosilactobacillus sp.]|uniref:glycoside hydrolase family 73 protein n=1 Tax=Limosilactobacillus sp. TaxID=2773925 RepID=UPI003F0016B6